MTLHSGTIDNFVGGGRVQSLTARPRERVRHITLWGLQVVLALLFVMSGLSKLGGAPEMVAMFDAIGVGQWFRYVTGALEVAGAVGLLIPRVRGLAALGLCVLMASATIITVVILKDQFWTPLGVLVVCAMVAWGRWSGLIALSHRSAHPSTNPQA